MPGSGDCMRSANWIAASAADHLSPHEILNLS
jgi:hypothetical protein